MNKGEIKAFLRDKPGYRKEGGKRLRNILSDRGFIVTITECKDAIREINTAVRNPIFTKHKDVIADAFTSTSKVKESPKNVIKKKNGKNVLVIGDLHLPFSLDSYLEHCIDTYKRFNCNEVIFIGDIIDNHASSYHETDPDGLNAGEELKLAIQQVKGWYEAFPKATVIIGNHDRIIMRKAYSSGLSKLWIKDYSEVLGVPSWTFTESVEVDNVLYIHGEGGTARSRIKADLQSTVQGHLHTQAYVEWVVGSNFKIFGMQVGCGIDHKSYAMAYAKAGKKPAISCGVVLQGSTAFNVMMNL